MSFCNLEIKNIEPLWIGYYCIFDGWNRIYTTGPYRNADFVTEGTLDNIHPKGLLRRVVTLSPFREGNYRFCDRCRVCFITLRDFKES